MIRIIGIVSISFDDRGYILIISGNPKSPLIKCGCREFNTKKAALIHYSSEIYPNKQRGQQYIKSIKLLWKIFKEIHKD